MKSLSTTLSRPGVSAETLHVAGIRITDTPEPGCLEIPYHDLKGQPTGFSRWRLARERADGQKYHQQPGTGTRAYIPPQFCSLAPGGDLVIVEGEFKALALIDAGTKAIGGPSFNTYSRDKDGGPQLLAGLADAIAHTKPERILFLGDADTSTNAEFARHAVFLANAVHPLPVVLPRLPLDGPKGIDDCREAFGAKKFKKFWAQIAGSAESIDLKSGFGLLAVRLLEREAGAVRALSGSERDKCVRRVATMGATMAGQPLAFDGLKSFVERTLGISRTAFKSAVTDAKLERSREGKERATRSTTSSQTPEGGHGHPVKTGGDSEPEAFSPNDWFKSRFPRLAVQHGEPMFETKGEEREVSRVADMSEDFMAATLGADGQPDAPTVFLPTEERFFGYEPSEGIFIQRREPELSARLSRLLLECARACREHCEVSKLEFGFRDSAALAGVLRRARGLLVVEADFFKRDATEFIAVTNGMLRLSDRNLLLFAPAYRRRNKLSVAYDSDARCPLFLDTLMRPALPEDDLSLVQRWCGLSLVGENLAQRLLLVTGTAGGGKGAFVRVVCGIIGQQNMASLRTGLLGERFELSRFLGRTLLYGADVSDEFLNQRTASVLKALTGGDLMTPEFKNSNEVPEMTCRFNAIVTSNSRLTVHLEGDTAAWRRRLAIIRYTRPTPAAVIADLSERILREEGSGVLNWMLDGLDQLRADGWQLHLNERQQRIVDDLLLESDGHREFVRRCLRKESNLTLLLNDAFAAYVDFCNERGWSAVTRNRFGKLIPDAVVQEHGAAVRRDIKDTAGKPQQGWKGLGLVRDRQWTSEKASEASGHTMPETIAEASEGLSPLHPTGSENQAEDGRPEQPVPRREDAAYV